MIRAGSASRSVHSKAWLSQSPSGSRISTQRMGTANLDAVLTGLEGSLSSEQVLPLWGVTTTDNVSFRQACQYCDDEIASDVVAYALLSGETQASWAIGYVPIGGERTVTRSRRNWC